MYLGEGEGWDPDSLLNGVNADVAVSAHVGVEDLGEESHLRWMEGVGEGNLPAYSDSELVKTS